MFYGMSLLQPVANHAWMHTISVGTWSKTYFSGCWKYAELPMGRKALPHICVVEVNLDGLRKCASFIVVARDTVTVTVTVESFEATVM